MQEYMISTGLWDTKVKRFETDKEAWEVLRKALPGKYGTLYVYQKMPCAVLNRKVLVPHHDAKYTLQKIGNKPYKRNIYIPIVFGCTDDEWSFDSDTLPRRMYQQQDKK